MSADAPQVYEIGREHAFGTTSSTIAAASYTHVARIAEHTHAFVEVVVVTDGSGVHRTERRTSHLTRGDLAIIRPGTWHSYDATDGVTLTNFYLAPELFHRELSWVLDYPGLTVGLLREGDSYAHLEGDSLHRVEGWLQQVEQLGGDTGPTLVGLATCVLGELIGLDFGTSTIDQLPISRPVRRAMELMQDNLAYDWTIDQLAREASVSPSYLHRLFRRELGRPPLVWLAQSRGERAATLLASSDHGIAQIATMVGWSDPSYASRRFRQIYGMSPSTYRSRFAAEAS